MMTLKPDDVDKREGSEGQQSPGQVVLTLTWGVGEWECNPWPFQWPVMIPERRS